MSTNPYEPMPAPTPPGNGGNNDDLLKQFLESMTDVVDNTNLLEEIKEITSEKSFSRKIKDKIENIFNKNS